MPNLQTFIYDNDLYIRVAPAKRLFHSTTVHEIVNRGDYFAVRLRDSYLTVIPGQAAVEKGVHEIVPVGVDRPSRIQLVNQLELKRIQREITELKKSMQT